MFVHHTVSEAKDDTKEANMEIVRGIQRFHQGPERNWDDIGYSFLIGADGSVFEGRGFRKVGAHTLGYNSRGYGVSFIGDYTNKLPPKATIEAFCNLVGLLKSQGDICDDLEVKAHRQVREGTECPGNAFFNSTLFEEVIMASSTRDMQWCH